MVTAGLDGVCTGVATGLAALVGGCLLGVVCAITAHVVNPKTKIQVTMFLSNLRVHGVFINDSFDA